MKKLVFVLLLFSCSNLFGQEYSFELFTEIIAGTGGLDNGSFNFELNGHTFFEAGTDETGLELWITDGTIENTKPFLDIFPGSESSKLGFSVHLGEKVIFSAADSLHGREPWITDGTVDGTFMLKDIYEGPEGSSVYAGIVFDGKLYFVSNTSENFKELWVTDGTTEGTQFLKIVCPNCTQISNSVGEFVLFKDKFIFKADFDMYISDGTAEGTNILYESGSFSENAFNGSAGLFFTDDSLIYYSHYLDGLYKTNGEEGAIVNIDSECKSAFSLQMYGNKLFYLAEVNNGFGWMFELKSYDPATGEVEDFYPTQQYSRSLFQFDERLYFRDEDKLYSTSGDTSDVVVEYEEQSWEHLEPHISSNFLVIEESSNTYIRKKEGEIVEIDGSLTNSFLLNDVLYGWKFNSDTGTELHFLDLNSLDFSSSTHEWSQVKELHAFPNPTSDLLFLPEDLDKLLVFDMMGNQVLCKTSDVGQISLKDLPPGTYIFYGIAGKKQYSQKIFKD